MRERFTLFRNIWETGQGDVVGIDDVIRIVTSQAMKDMTDYVRGDARLYAERKKMLPNITVNGIFSQRNDNCLTDYSGVVCIDFDHIPVPELPWMKDCLRRWPHTLFLFTSPSGKGLKLFIRHDLTDPVLHQNLYLQIVRTFREEWGCRYVDGCTKDLSRATFLSYDPDCFHNPGAAPLHYVYDSGFQAPPVVHSQAAKRNSPMTPGMITRNMECQASWSDKALVGYIDRHEWDAFRTDYQEGHRNNSILRKAGQLFRCGVHYDVALAKLTHLYCEAFSDMLPSEVEPRVHYIYSTSDEADFGCQRMMWLAKRNEGVAVFLGKGIK